MSPIVEVQGLTKRYRDVTAVDNVSFSLAENAIHGLLGRNGAGKTTLMQMLTGEEFATSGSIKVWGESPLENAAVLQDVCFIKEAQRYPDDFKVKHALAMAPRFFPRWDEDFAASLVQDFELPLKRRIKKLSRGQLSAVGVVIGLASRAPLTFFDEPYLGLDAVARHTFYDRLLADYAAHPRTVVLSTHLIDEVANLLEHVVMIDRGTIVIDDDVDHLRASTVAVAGKVADVDSFASTRSPLSRSQVGGLATVVIPHVSDQDRAQAQAAGLEVSPVTLQELLVHRSSTPIQEDNS